MSNRTDVPLSHTALPKLYPHINPPGAASFDRVCKPPPPPPPWLQPQWSPSWATLGADLTRLARHSPSLSPNPNVCQCTSGQPQENPHNGPRWFSTVHRNVECEPAEWQSVASAALGPWVRQHLGPLSHSGVSHTTWLCRMPPPLCHCSALYHYVAVTEYLRNARNRNVDPYCFAAQVSTALACAVTGSL